MSYLENIEILKLGRRTIFDQITNLNFDDMIIVPENFNNNILWNLGHIVVTQQLLHYTLSGLPTYIDKGFIRKFRTGSECGNSFTTEEIKVINELLITLPDKLNEDYKQEIFKKYKPMKTMIGFEVNNIDDAIRFNNFHEGTHLGVILSIKKFL